MGVLPCIVKDRLGILRPADRALAPRILRHRLDVQDIVPLAKYHLPQSLRLLK